MPVTDLLERNHKLYGDEIALVELNPLVKDTKRTTWKEYNLVQQTSYEPYRREITWSVFDEKANRVANMLLSRGIKKGDRVAILMFNCLEWLPIYFGILKTGAIAVPFNFRFDAKEILYCDREEARILKTNDFNLYAHMLYKKDKVELPKIQNNLLEQIKKVKTVEIYIKDLEKIEKYLYKEKCQKEKEKIDKSYQIYTLNEIEEQFENTILFILDILKKLKIY